MSTLVSFDRLLQLAERKGIRPVLENLEADIMAEKESRKRIPRPPAPEGGISINAASKKYKIAKTTLYQWVKKKYIPVIKSTKYETFITESCVAKIAEEYKPRRGSWDVKKLFEGLN